LEPCDGCIVNSVLLYLCSYSSVPDITAVGIAAEASLWEEEEGGHLTMDSGDGSSTEFSDESDKDNLFIVRK